jgi:hypothetical protein
MQFFIHKLAAVFAAVALAAALASCGGGSSGSGVDDPNQIQGKGTVGILLTDKPADPAMFDAIIASIVKVELMGSEENGRVELFSAPPTKEFDLLRLRNESIPLAFKDNIPAGTYCKIRLTLSRLELVLTNGDRAYPKLPGNGKLDLVVRDCFDVVAGEVLALQLDMDAGNSFHIIEKGNCTSKPDKCFNFRPVVFVDVIEKDFNSKLVRLSGHITEIYPEVTLLNPPLVESLLLCEALPSRDMDNEGCVKVHFGKNSAFFDNAPFSDDGNDNNDGNDGKPTPIYNLRNYMGEELTVVGWVKSWPDKDHDYDKPEAYYPLLYLEALVAELGDFRRVDGKVEMLNDPVDTGFSMALSSENDSLDVIYQPELYPTQADINGTRIVSKSGKLLEPEDIEIFVPVQVDGTPDDDNSTTINAALVIVDQSALDTEQVTGVIQSLGIDTLKLAPDEYPCGAVTDPFIVDLIDPLKILTVIITDDGSEISPGGILEELQTVGMNGSCEFTGNYSTDNIVIVDDRR